MNMKTKGKACISWNSLPWLNGHFFRQRGGRWRHKQIHPLAFSSLSPPPTCHTISLSPSPRVQLRTRRIVLFDDLMSLSVTGMQIQRHAHIITYSGRSLASWQILLKVMCQSALTAMIKSYRFRPTQETRRNPMSNKCCETASCYANARSWADLYLFNVHPTWVLMTHRKN